MADLKTEKRIAAVRAAAEVQDGMVVGLGTGSTATYAIHEIGRRVDQDGLHITATASSEASRSLACSLGIPVRPMGEFSQLDLVIDGADEIDPHLRMIKGGGGALFREKILATAAARVIIAVDSSKRVPILGRRALPVEVHPFALQFVTAKLDGFGGDAQLRLGLDGRPFRTEQGAVILDVALGQIEEPAALAAQIDAIPGVFAHGLFLGLAHKLIIGVGKDVEVSNRPLFS